jgi:hypothetical protein
MAGKVFILDGGKSKTGNNQSSRQNRIYMSSNSIWDTFK